MRLTILSAYASTLSVFLPIAIGIYRWRYLRKYLKLLLVIILLAGVSDAFSFMLIKKSINSWPILNIFYFLQFIYLYLIFKYHSPGKTLSVFTIIFIAFAVINFSFIQQPYQFNTYSSYLGSLLLLLFSVVYLNKLMNNLQVDAIQSLPMFWISFGVLAYFGGTLFLFLFNNVLMKHQPTNHQLVWVLHNVLNITKNLFFAIALWKSSKDRVL